MWHNVVFGLFMVVVTWVVFSVPEKQEEYTADSNGELFELSGTDFGFSDAVNHIQVKRTQRAGGVSYILFDAPVDAARQWALQHYQMYHPLGLDAETNKLEFVPIKGSGQEPRDFLKQLPASPPEWWHPGELEEGLTLPRDYPQQPFIWIDTNSLRSYAFSMEP